jgi:glycosyltransferase involved in cell wall biosynthesis
MAKSVAAILDRPTLREDLREAGLRRARLFTWQKTAERTIQVYRHVYEKYRKHVHSR